VDARRNATEYLKAKDDALLFIADPKAANPDVVSAKQHG
jgi:hypothetical protein